MRPLKMVYSRAPRVITARQAACTAPTVLGSANRSLTTLNNCFPAIPPAAAPMARGVPVFLSIWLPPDAMVRPTEYRLMESTVSPDKKLMVDTLASPHTSRTGLMITPPPMPQMAPATDAKKLTSR